MAKKIAIRLWQIRWFQETRKSPSNKFYLAKITFKFQILFEFWCRNQLQPYKIIRQNFNIKPLTLPYMQWEKKNKSLAIVKVCHTFKYLYWWIVWNFAIGTNRKMVVCCRFLICRYVRIWVSKSMWCTV